MKPIKFFIGRFDNWVPSAVQVKKTVQKVIRERLKTDIEPKQIKISSGIIYLDVPSPLKSEIFLHREEILRELQKELGRQLVQKIL